MDDHPAPPARHGQRWTEGDFSDVMDAVRDGLSLEEIAERIGRSVSGLRGQLRRMLPADERHIPADAVLLRLRRLDRDGDYDWLAAMVERPTPEWQLRQEAEHRSRVALVESARQVGIGVLSNHDLVDLAAGMIRTHCGFSEDLRTIVATLLSERGLVDDLCSFMRWSETRSTELFLASRESEDHRVDREHDPDGGFDQPW